VTVLTELPTLHVPETQHSGAAGGTGAADPDHNGHGGGGPPNRIATSWKKVLAAGILCFVVWTVLDAPTLMNSAEGSPLGLRRTVAMDFLRPIAWISRETGLSHIVGAADRILGRGGSGAVQVSSGPPIKVTGPPATSPETTVVTTKTGRRVTKSVVLADGWAPFPKFTPASPLRVLIVGDSVGTDLGQYALVDQLGSTQIVSATLDGHISTGLTRPDYFNWPAELENDLAHFHPQLTIICIGANDAQNTIVNGQVLVYGTQAWDNMYSSRVGAFIAEATSAGSRVLWVGMPPMASSQLNAQMQHLDYLYATQVGRHKGARYLSSVPSLGGPGGSYTAFKTVDGSYEEIRTDDGIHLQAAGAQLLGEAVISDMDAVYRLHLHP
jgi:uncharacterized protein